MLPLDARCIGVSHPISLAVKGSGNEGKGFVRVEAFWFDEAKPRKETGDFYYRVRWIPMHYVALLLHLTVCGGILRDRRSMIRVGRTT